ncbi:MAG: F0F1 ATP synthase subunit delta [Candidatus Saccharibacteria bacterium]
MKNKLPLSIVTPADVTDCLSDLSQYQKSVQNNHLVHKVGGATKPAVTELSQPAIDLLGVGEKLPTNEDIIQAMDYLAALHKQPLVLHLTVVAELPLKGQVAIAEWFRDSCHPEALLSFSVNSQIGGGIKVRTPYHLHDYSYASQLEANKKDLIKELARV